MGVVLLGGMAALGQTPAPQAAPAGLPSASTQTNLVAGSSVSDATATTLEVRLAEARANLAAAVAPGAAGLTNAPAGVSPQDFWVRRAMMHRLVRLY
jgi:hypothetical protein